MQKFELLDEIDRVRNKAYALLKTNDYEKRKQKLLISKYHQCLRDHDMNDDEISEFVYLCENEIA